MRYLSCKPSFSLDNLYYFTITRTTTFQDGNVLTAAQLNGEFNNLGNAPAIMNSDVASNAAIASSKLSFGGTSGQFLKSNGDGTLSYSSQTINRAFGFFIAGTPSVANDLSWDPTAPQAMTALKIWAKCQTAPTGSAVVLRIFNVTQSAAVGSVTINTSATTGTSTSFTTPAIVQGDILRIDCTTADSNSVGANFSVILETSQP